MANDKFTIKEAMAYGWQSFKAHVPFFLGFMVVMALLTFVPDWLSDRMFTPKSAPWVIARIIVRLIGLLLGMLSTRIALNLHDTGEPQLNTLSHLLPLSLAYIFGKVLYGLIVVVGLILLIVPGLVVAYMFLYVGYIIIDRQMGPVAALQESRVITDGYKWDLFVFSLVVALANILGAICLFVGLLVSIPVTMMASVYVYRKLSPAEPVAETA